MPALIGGFGKIHINKIKRYFSKEWNVKKESIVKIESNVKTESNRTESELRSKIGSYLAGLIEADGSIAVHSKDSNAKKYRPKILVVFNLADQPLATKLASITNAGTIYVKNNAGCVIWHNYNIECLDLDQSPIDSNAWLAGFTDGDGNFSITLTNRKKRGNITSKRIQTFFRIELRQTYHRHVSVEQGGTSYYAILNKIATFLGVNLLSRTREQRDKIFYAFMVISHSAASHAKVISYFNRFPLYSSKYLAYKDWSYVVEQAGLRAGKVLTQKEILEVETIKAQFNSKRKSFDFSHLDSLD